MLYTIRKHLLDILAADARLLQGGAAYAARYGLNAWRGVLRPDAGVVAAAGYVNLFDEAYKKVGENHRPAIYVGTRAMKATDRLEFQAISGLQGRIEYRIMLIPLVICASAPTEDLADRQRDQLMNNVKQILMSPTSVIASGYWYELTMPGATGGGAALEHAWTTDTGAGSSGGAAQLGQNSTLGLAEAMCTIPCQIRYSFALNSPA